VNPIKESTIPNGHDRAADRAAINRANAEKSTGPRTEAGKQRSKLNALRHGLTGQTVVLPTEDLSAYQRHSKSFLDEYQPQGATETQLTQSLIDTSWRMNRAAAVENNLLSLGIIEHEFDIHTENPQAHAALAMALAFRENSRALSNISIQSQRLVRQFERTLVLLRQLQADRRANEERLLDKAARILKMHKDENLPYEPAEDGFVFSNAQIETFLHRQDRSTQANIHNFYACAKRGADVRPAVS
jgi:hypothetical protein